MVKVIQLHKQVDLRQDGNREKGGSLEMLKCEHPQLMFLGSGVVYIPKEVGIY